MVLSCFCANSIALFGEDINTETIIAADGDVPMIGGPTYDTGVVNNVGTLGLLF